MNFLCLLGKSLDFAPILTHSHTTLCNKNWQIMTSYFSTDAKKICFCSLRARLYAAFYDLKAIEHTPR